MRLSRHLLAMTKTVGGGNVSPGHLDEYIYLRFPGDSGKILQLKSGVRGVAQSG